MSSENKKKKKGFCSKFFPAIFIVTLLISLYVIFAIAMAEGIVNQTHETYPNSNLVGFIITTFLYVMMVTCFLLASFTNPGEVSSVWPWDPEKPEIGNEELIKLVYENFYDCKYYEHQLESDFHRVQKARKDIEIPQDGPPQRDIDSSEVAEKLLQYDRDSNSLNLSVVNEIIPVRGIERKKKDGKNRFCRICGKYKPDRAHHDSNTSTCILELDHFCPWILNCVGYRNKKYFFLLLLYSSACLFSFLITLGPHLVISGSTAEPIDGFVIFAWILGALLYCVILSFFIFHIWLACNAYTTIEYCEKRRAADTKINAQGIKVKDIYAFSPFDHGTLQNLKHILGPYIGLWLIPTRYGMPDNPYAGAMFRINPDHMLIKSL